jgi:hypothetical protein
MDAQTLGVGVVFGGLVVGGVWRAWTWRQEHATLVKVQIDLGIVQVWPNRGLHGVLAQIMLPTLAGIPGVVGPHDSAMTWWNQADLADNAFDLTRPLRGRVSLAERDGFIWSKRKQLLKKS